MEKIKILDYGDQVLYSQTDNERLGFINQTIESIKNSSLYLNENQKNNLGELRHEFLTIVKKYKVIIESLMKSVKENRN